jgi:hypothetical protein
MIRPSIPAPRPAPAPATVSMVVALTLVAVLASGCDKIPFIGGGSGSTDTTAAPDSATAAMAAPDTAAAAPAPAPAPAQTTPAPAAPNRQPARQQPTRPARQQSVAEDLGELPWNPQFSGTVRPGMSREEVVGEWGPPATERTMGDWTYLYYRNGCERRCGTFDIAFLQGGQVVDAVVRAPQHAYTGVSSSPANVEARFTPPDQARADTLGIRG